MASAWMASMQPSTNFSRGALGVRTGTPGTDPIEDLTPSQEPEETPPVPQANLPPRGGIEGIQ